MRIKAYHLGGKKTFRAVRAVTVSYNMRGIAARKLKLKATINSRKSLDELVNCLAVIRECLVS